MCACLGVGECMMMVREVVPAGGGHRLELVVGKGISEVFP